MTATDGTGPLFLTGVVYTDTNGNGRMDVGEGLSDVTVAAGTFSTKSNAAGGWALRVPAGSYRVSASGGRFEREVDGGRRASAGSTSNSTSSPGEGVPRVLLPDLRRAFPHHPGHRCR